MSVFVCIRLWIWIPQTGLYSFNWETLDVVFKPYVYEVTMGEKLTSGGSECVSECLSICIAYTIANILCWLMKHTSYDGKYIKLKDA